MYKTLPRNIRTLGNKYLQRKLTSNCDNIHFPKNCRYSDIYKCIAHQVEISKQFLRTEYFYNNNLHSEIISEDAYDAGLYYETIKEDYVMMSVYYHIAINKGNTHAMNRFGLYYQNIVKNYDKAREYFSMAVDYNSHEAMFNLGYYYMNIEKNQQLGVEYYTAALNHGNSDAMYAMGDYCLYQLKDENLSQKFFHMASEKGDSMATTKIGHYYQSIDDYTIMKYYYEKAIKDKNIYALTQLAYYYLMNNMYYQLLKLYVRNHDMIPLSKIIETINYIIMWRPDDLNWERTEMLLQRILDCDVSDSTIRTILIDKISYVQTLRNMPNIRE